MEVNLCLMNSLLLLYPEAQAREDRRCPLRGYVELNCKDDCDVEVLRLRLVGTSKTSYDTAGQLRKAEQRQGGPSKDSGLDATLLQTAPTKTLLIKDATLMLDVATGKAFPCAEGGSNKFTKGRHVIAFEIDVPKSTPASQQSLFHHIMYKLVLFVRGRPSKSFVKLLKLPFTFNISQPVQIDVHPSSDGHLNVTSNRMQPQSDRQGLHALLSSKNARWGGCFSVRLRYPTKNDTDTIKLLDVQLILEQRWSMDGKTIEGMTTTESIANSEAIESDQIETMQDDAVVLTPPNYTEMSSQDNNEKCCDSPAEPSEDAGLIADESSHQHRAVQVIKLHAFFPHSTGPSLGKQDLLSFKRSWLPTTPARTNDVVRVEHTLTCSIEYKIADDALDSNHFSHFSTPIAIVDESMRTAVLQLPEYEDVAT